MISIVRCDCYRYVECMECIKQTGFWQDISFPVSLFLIYLMRTMFEIVYKEECNLFGDCSEQNFELKKACFTLN